jgi:hypothetical protein
MPDVYTFLKDGLSSFQDNGIYDRDLREHCLKLNEYLNHVTVQDYDSCLNTNANFINNEIARINISINDILYVDLSKIVILLRNFQRDHQIAERDHYYHSIQCFLLAIALFNKFYPFQSVPSDIIAILYSLTMYHDIGYLYKAIKISEKQINESLANFFLCRDCFHESDMVGTLCLRTEPYQSSEIIMDIMTTIKNSNEIQNIWAPKSLSGQILLKNDTGLPTFSVEYEKSHVYNSALLLAKVLYTKNIIKYYCNTVLAVDINDEKSNWFKKVLRAIYLHGREELSPKLDIATDFYSVYLIIIDELQTYGRQLSCDTRNVLINPKNVGFHWDGANLNKLLFDVITVDPKLKMECSAHNQEKVRSILEKKITNQSLLSI